MLTDHLPHPCPAALKARLKNPKNAQLWLAAVRTELRAQNIKAGESLRAKALQVGGQQGGWGGRWDRWVGGRQDVWGGGR